MRRPIAHLIAVILVCSTLAACVSTPGSAPTATPTTASASPTESSTSTPSPSAPSNPPPQQVLGLSAMSGGGSGEVVLRWTQNPEEDVVSYIVLRASTAGGPLAQIATVTRDEVAQFEDQPFIDFGVSVAYYRVSAVDSAGQEGAMSVEVCGASPIDHC